MTFEESRPVEGESEQKSEFRAGFVAIAGKPNVGKSTLMNALIGAKVSAVSRRPQTTREQIKGILTRDDGQIVFVDMPGLIQPRDRFNECLMEQAVEALRDVDLLYHLVEADDPAPLSPEVAEALARVKCPRFLVVNKIDRLAKNAPRETPVLSQILAHYDETFWISALTGQGLPQLLDRTMARLPVHPPYYEGDELTDRDARFLAAEIVREKLFELTGQEVPYSIATECEEFKERAEQKHYIRVRIYVERESQKKLVIGAEGRVLKKVGELARKDIEALLGHPVYLELWVKVLKNWRKNEADLRRLGYKISQKKR